MIYIYTYIAPPKILKHVVYVFAVLEGSAKGNWGVVVID